MKHKILQRDQLRPILTDLIPYEVPLRFSYLHFHQLLASTANTGPIIQRLLKARAGRSFPAVPYTYSIQHGEGKQRVLGLLHPLLLSNAAHIYSDFDGTILSLCSKSPWSLRFPSRVARMYFSKSSEAPANVKDCADDDEEELRQNVGIPAEDAATVQEHASTYFAYSRYNFLHRYYESAELLQLERRFSRCRRVDIARCFGNIYTHTISWAAKGKSQAKADVACTKTFDAKMDDLMQSANHKETHGILIGPEFSRIFAEIILQEVDIRAIASLRMEAGDACDHENPSLIDGHDYTVRRYIDDYFIYFNDINVADQVQRTIEKQLAFYKLYLNESKTRDTVRPFISPISAAKREIRDLFSRLLDCNIVRDGQGSPAGDGSRFCVRSSRVLADLRLVLAKLDLPISDVSGPALAQLGTILRRRLPSIVAATSLLGTAGEWVRCILEVAFYLFAVDSRFRASVLIGRMLSALFEAFPRLPSSLVREIEDLVMREALSIIRQFAEKRELGRLEAVNFLTCLRSLDGYWRIPQALVKDLVPEALDDYRVADYFVIVPILYFCGDRIEYAELRQSLVEAAVRRIWTVEDLIQDTGVFSLALDLLSCPSVDRFSKACIANRLLRELDTPAPSESDENQLVNEFSTRTWFFDWRDCVATSVYLEKKELSLAY